MNLAEVPRRPTRVDDTITRLRDQVTSGAWPVGTRIPTEPELVDRLGVARNTVREAVRALVHTGLLEARQGSGTFVVATSELAGLMQQRFAHADRDDLNDVRAALESSAAGRAAVRRTDADLAHLDVALHRRERAWHSGDAAAFAAADATFHLAVVAAAHNRVLTELYADLREVVRTFIRAELGTELRPEQYVDHARLVDAIRRQDVRAAGAEAAAHPHSWDPPPAPTR